MARLHSERFGNIDLYLMFRNIQFMLKAIKLSESFGYSFTLQVVIKGKLVHFYPPP